jgi:methionyl-tRNA synthetase
MGKDNITFHSQIWPSELLGYRGIGDKGGEPGKYGDLQLPTEVVSSEFLSMEGKKFSSSRGVVIYVKDFLDRYQPDALRYYISAAGPENQDADFTWDGFLRRTNTELVAGWGNLVNRVANMVAKSFGEIPEAPGGVDELENIDKALLEKVNEGFGRIGALIEHHHQKQALAELMQVVGEANTYISATEPFKLKGDVLGSEEATQKRLKQVLFTCVQAVVDINAMFTVFLPHSSEKIYAIFGGGAGICAGEGPVSAAPQPVIEEVTDLDDSSRNYPIITGDYEVGRTILEWKHHPVVPGTPIAKPEPVFIRLDDGIVEEELKRMTGEE